MRTIFLDGRYLKVRDPLLDVFRPGSFRAEGVFETMLGLDGTVLDALAHLQRLRQGLKVLGLKVPAVHARILTEVLRRNALPCARVRLMVWQAGRQTHVMAVALPYQMIDKTYRVCVVATNRPASSRLSCVKSLDYELFAHAYEKARAQGFDEALLLNKKGFIFEASRANIFWSKDKVLYTPPLSSGCLNGITRQQVIRQAKFLRIPVKEKRLTPAILKQADTAFLTNALIGIQPIAISR